MDGVFQFALVAFTTIFFIVDPFAVVPTFLVLTEADGPERRRRIAKRAAIATGIILVVFATAGRFIFRAFGITLAAFHVAGGVILFLVAVDMMRASRSTQEGPPEIEEGMGKEDVAVMPLAVPMLAGPGAISMVMVLISRAETPLATAIVYAGIVVTAAATLVVLRLASPLSRLLGRTGVRILTRLMGLIVAAIAVQFVFDGLVMAGFVSTR